MKRRSNGPTTAPKTEASSHEVVGHSATAGVESIGDGKATQLKTSYSRVCEFEKGIREPNLLVLLRYSDIAGVHMETLVNDKVELSDK